MAAEALFHYPGPLLLSILAMVVTFFYVSFFGEIGVVLAVIMGVLIFIIGLAVTRLFDVQIVKVTKYIVNRLADYPKIRDFIMNHFLGRKGAQSLFN